MTEKKKVLQDTKTQIEKLRSPGHSFGSNEYEVGYYEGWFDAKEEILANVLKQIKELSEVK